MTLQLARPLGNRTPSTRRPSTPCAQSDFQRNSRDLLWQILESASRSQPLHTVPSPQYQHQNRSALLVGWLQPRGDRRFGCRLRARAAGRAAAGARCRAARCAVAGRTGDHPGGHRSAGAQHANAARLPCRMHLCTAPDDSYYTLVFMHVVSMITTTCQCRLAIMSAAVRLCMCSSCL